MDRNNERSFVARVYSDGKKMEFLQTSRNANILTTREGSGPPHAYDPISKKCVPVGRGPLKSTLLVHFRCYDSHYQLQILGLNDTYLSADYDDVLGAFSSTQRDVTSFTLLNADHQPITLDDLNDPQADIYLQSDNAGLIKQSIFEKWGYTYTCFTHTAGDLRLFNLDILQRQVVTPDSPEQYD